MAETNVPITAGSGTAIDGFTLTSPANIRQAVVIGDKSTNAAVAPVDATKGLAVDLTATGANSTAIKVDNSAVTQPVSGTVTATQGTATNLKTQAESYQGGSAVASGNPLEVNLRSSTIAVATSTKQSDGSQKSQIVDGSGNVIGATTNALDVNIKSGNPTTIATTHTDTAPATQTITAADAATTSTSQQNSQAAVTGAPTANSFATFAISGLDSVLVQITGTWVATLVTEYSMDGGTTYFTRGIHLSGTNYTAASFTSNATGNLNAAGATHVRVRATAYTSGTATVRISGSVNPSAFYLTNNPKIADGTTPSQTLAVDSSGAASVNTTKVSGTAVDVNNGTVSAGTQRVTLASDGTGQVKTTNFPTTVDTNAGAVGASTIRVVQGAKTINTTSGTAASSGNNTIQAAGTNKLKIFAFSLSTTSTAAVTCIFQSGASGTELWRVTLQAISGGNVGANLAVSLPTYLFATASATLLNLNLSSANTVHYSVSYIDEA